MFKKIIILLLCAAMILPVTVYGQENTLTIETAEDLLAFAEDCRIDSFSRDLTVKLQEDIDLTNTDFNGIPIFAGRFLGEGHKITGFSVNHEGSYVGFFRYLTETAVVSDLHLEAVIQPSGSRNYVGGIVGSNSGTIENCTFTGVLSGNTFTGGITGTNTTTGAIRGCTVNGEASGMHFVGGIAGENKGLIQKCKNNAAVNTKPLDTGLRLEDITVDSLTGTELSNSATDVGGIAGNSVGLILECVNYGNVGYPHIGYNIGGIAGAQMGYINACENYGRVAGRKEVGGIVGQMEPVTRLIYAKDTLQLLREELDELATLMDAVLHNSKNNAQQVKNYLKEVQGYLDAADEAIKMIPVPELDGKLPQQEEYLAAWNALSAALQNAMTSLKNLSVAMENTSTALTNDLQAVYDQMQVVRGVLAQDQENLGGSLSDVSDEDTKEDITAKLLLCKNFGEIIADLNAGGIAGAMSIENDLDPEADTQIAGTASLNFDTHLRGVILSCSNYGAVTADKYNVGGIVGMLSIGLVKESVNQGSLNNPEARYVGGIAGISTGFIRNCYARCEVAGEISVGGIAGLADCVSDSSVVVTVSATEKVGAILGETDSLDEILNNQYSLIGRDIGGVDGISYEGHAQLADMDQLFMPEEMEKSIEVSFVFEDGTHQIVTLDLGEKLESAQIPELPAKVGYTAYWDNLPNGAIWFDVTIRAVYSANPTSIQSAKTDEAGRPYLLAVGNFTEISSIEVVDTTVTYRLEKGERRICEFALTTKDVSTPLEIRYLVTEYFDADSAKLYVYSGGNWKELSFRKDGNYIAFSVEDPQAQLALVEVESMTWLWIAVICTAVLLLVCVIGLIKMRKSRKLSE